MPKGQRTGANNPIPERGTRWHRRNGPAGHNGGIVVVEEVYKDERRGDVRIEYRSEATGFASSTWYARFKLPSAFWPAEETPKAKSEPTPAPVVAAPASNENGAAITAAQVDRALDLLASTVAKLGEINRNLDRLADAWTVQAEKPRALNGIAVAS